MSYIFWKLLVQRLILAINQVFWSILRGVRILLTRCNRIVHKIWHHVIYSKRKLFPVQCWHLSCWESFCCPTTFGKFIFIKGYEEDSVKFYLGQNLVLNCDLTTINPTYCDKKDWKHQKLLNLTYPRQTCFMSRVPKHYTTCSNNTLRFHRSFYQCTLFDQWSLTSMLRFCL